jgi:pimeloyl-ACP methyl ester carboxylesterase
MSYASVGDMCLFYDDETGAGMPVLLAHGGFSDISEWQHQVAPLSERYRVIQYDRRGCGRSQPRDVPQDPALWAEDQAQLIN